MYLILAGSLLLEGGGQADGGHHGIALEPFWLLPSMDSQRAKGRKWIQMLSSHDLRRLKVACQMSSPTDPYGVSFTYLIITVDWILVKIASIDYIMVLLQQQLAQQTNGRALSEDH